MSVANFAETIGKASGVVVKTLVMNGVMVTLNEKIDYDTASLIASELGVEVFPDNLEIEKNNVSSADLNNLAMRRLRLGASWFGYQWGRRG